MNEFVLDVDMLEQESNESKGLLSMTFLQCKRPFLSSTFLSTASPRLTGLVHVELRHIFFKNALLRRVSLS